jgi:hypothetical protein
MNYYAKRLVPPSKAGLARIKSYYAKVFALKVRKDTQYAEKFM